MADVEKWYLEKLMKFAIPQRLQVKKGGKGYLDVSKQQLDSNMMFASTILFSSSHKLKNVIDEQRSAAFAVMFLAWSSGSFNSAMAHVTEPPCLASLSMTMIP